jgi:hypothetical protein
VLWHAHAGKLWYRFVIGLRRQLASSVGLVQSRFAEHARLSFARVAEYQERAAVHVHASSASTARPDPTTNPRPGAPSIFRGHILIKSRAYSTTYAALRAERADHMGHADLPEGVTERHWRYVGSGHTPGAALVAAGIAEDIATNREIAREEREVIR